METEQQQDATPRQRHERGNGNGQTACMMLSIDRLAGKLAAGRSCCVRVNSIFGVSSTLSLSLEQLFERESLYDFCVGYSMSIVQLPSACPTSCID
jgi:hypothetical protein